MLAQFEIGASWRKKRKKRKIAFKGAVRFWRGFQAVPKAKVEGAPPLACVRRHNVTMPVFIEDYRIHAVTLRRNMPSTP